VYGIPLANKKVPCLIKDENNSAIMTGFVELRAKMYVFAVSTAKKIRKKSKVLRVTLLPSR